EQIKIVKDVGLACISIFGVFISTFVGIGLVYKEIDKKTIYNILSKPITRFQFLLGKYFGLLFTVLINVMIMVFCLLTILYFISGTIAFNLFTAVLLIIVELMLIISIAILFSTFSTPTLSAIFTLAVYVIGHLTSDIRVFGNRTESAAINKLTEFLYYVLPNLENFNIKTQIVHRLPVSHEFIIFSFCYGLIYIGLVLLLAGIIFNIRDFK
ncbi:MAG: ABC transporter permease, partial [Thermodesulfobacteriota bacterium]|nr:ABC transporter permease [Thermodesulfobacteriota bacterium]